MAQGNYFFALGGGMDLVTPELQKPPGRVVASLNYEPTGSGYRRLRGFERYDGRLAPSTATGYHVIHFQEGHGNFAAIVAGTQIRNTGDTSWRAFAVAPPVVTAGAAETNDAAGYIGVAIVQTGWMPVAGIWRRGPGFGQTFASVAEPAVVADEPVPEAAGGAWLRGAIEARRLAIQPVPGSGPVRGVWQHGEAIVAVRDNADATAAILHSAGITGWAPVNFARVYNFTDGGPFEPFRGDAANGEISGAQGNIRAINLVSGAWADADAAGTIAILNGLFQAGESVAVVDFTGTTFPEPHFPGAFILADGGSTYQLPAGGRCEFITNNFYGASDLSRTYCVDGVGNAFEYDSDILVAIETGMATDAPTHIAAYAGRLFLSFPGGSIQYSQVGEPTLFDPVLGAGEIGMGCECTGFANAPNALAIFGTDNISLLYGHDEGDFVLETLNREAGALPHTAQKLGDIVYMDNRGLRSLGASRAYGNFAQGTLSRLIAPLLEDYRRDGNDPVASFVSRAQDQYWCFFENGAGFVAYFGKKSPEILPFNLGRTIACACSVEADGVERIFLGGGDGYVYELGRGTSFDGAPIEHYLRLPFYNFGSPHQNKHLHKLSLELEASGATTLSVSADLDYGSVEGLDPVQLSVTTGGGAIDDLGSNELYFASQIETIAEAWVGALARNISLKVSGLTENEEPHTLTGVSFFASPRGLKR